MNISGGVAIGAGMAGGALVGGFVGDRLMGDVASHDQVGKGSQGLLTLAIGGASFYTGVSLIDGGNVAQSAVGAGLMLGGLSTWMVGFTAPGRYRA